MNPPATTLHTPFGSCFAVQSGIPVREALEQLAQLLGNSRALCVETVDADLRQMRSLVATINRQLEMGQGLLEASLHSLHS